MTLSTEQAKKSTCALFQSTLFLKMLYILFMNRYEHFQQALREEAFRKKIRIAFHLTLLSSLLLFAIFAYSYSWPLTIDFLTRDVFEYGTVTLYTYTIYALHIKNKHFAIRLVSVFLMICSLIVLAYYKNSERFGSISEHVFDDLMSYLGFGLLLFLSFIYVDNIHIFLNRKYHDIQKTLKDAESQLLRQQFNPHFLFNALNSVYSMALNQHPKTADTILTFSAMMRYLSDEATTEKVTLKHEIDFISSYIEMEKIRFGENAKISFTLKDSIDNYMIEALLLITLIENAFKHGFYTNNADSYVHIHIEIKEAILHLNVKNGLYPNQENQRTGKGLVILRKRLDLSYEKKYTLSCQKKEAFFEAHLTLDLSE